MTDHLLHDGSAGQRKRFRVSMVGLALMALVLPACNTPEQAVAPPGEQGTTVERVNENLSALVGQTVRLRSEVESTNDPNSFRLEDNDAFAGEDVLVFNATGQPFVIPDEDMEVQVTGQVRQFAIAEAERSYDLDLNTDTYAAYEKQPVIFADSLALAPDLDDLTDDPEEFYNRRIAIEGEVSAVNNASTFVLKNQGLFGGENLLVIAPNATRAIADGETVGLVGELRRFVWADLERDYDLTWDADLQRELEAEYQNEPIFVAREIYSSVQDE